MNDPKDTAARLFIWCVAIVGGIIILRIVLTMATAIIREVQS